MSEKKAKKERKKQPQQKQVGQLIATFFVDEQGRTGVSVTGFPADNLDRAQVWLHHIYRVVAQYYVKQAKGEVEPSRILTPQGSKLVGLN